MTAAARPTVTVRAAVLLVVLAVGVLTGLGIAHSRQRVSGSTLAITPSAVDIGFAQDMITHHQQALTMARLVEGRSTAVVNNLASEIISNQSVEIGQLQGFLLLWQAPMLPTGPPMTWMQPPPAKAGNDMPGMVDMVPSRAGPLAAPGPGSMPGMASQDQLDSLAAADGPHMEALFLRLMLRHHLGGIAMAHYAVDHSRVPALQQLAGRMILEQSAESRLLSALLHRPGQPG